MNTEPYGITKFCDDIRQEATGKTTLVGCYGGAMQFSQPAPAILPIFAAMIEIRIPTEIKFENLKVKLIMETNGNQNVLFERTTNLLIDDTDTEKLPVPPPGAPTVRMISMPVAITGLEISGPSVVKVRAYLDDEIEILAGGLQIGFPAAAEVSTD